MTRLYYTDPLAAAYMAREFGVIIIAEQPDKNLVPVEDWCCIKGSAGCFLEYGVRTDLTRGNTWLSYSTCHLFHIHPDSLHIFEPQVGDLLSDGEVAGFYYGSKDTIRVPERHNGKRYYVMADGKGKIIQRQGKPFFTPETETEEK